MFKYRLYSVKTGVKYVGSNDESGAGKHRLEANCSLAMLRSEVIESLHNSDQTFGIQTEVLTITAPMTDEETGQITRDGFQVRNLSCMRSGLQWMPGQAIPYGRAAFDHVPQSKDSPEKDADKQCEFWRKAFAVPLGRAKARLFLNYGLVHTSANAQNFLLGFGGFKIGQPVLQQFVARDIGDTSWHDDYLTNYVGHVAYGKKVCKAFEKEKGSAIRHILRETTSSAYPPPRMVRLAAYSVLTHDFAKTLKDKHRWTDAHVYKFATGILDGFREFMQEAFDLGNLYPVDPDPKFLSDTAIRNFGVDGKYPYPWSPRQETPREKAYKKIVDNLLLKAPDALFSNAAWVRQRGEQHDFDAFKTSSDDGICHLINAEEILLCAGLEVRLRVRERGCSNNR